MGRRLYTGANRPGGAATGVRTTGGRDSTRVELVIALVDAVDADVDAGKVEVEVEVDDVGAGAVDDGRGPAVAVGDAGTAWPQVTADTSNTPATTPIRVARGAVALSPKPPPLQVTFISTSAG